MMSLNCFSATELIYYAEELLRDMKIQEINAEPSKYNWLKTKSWQSDRNCLDSSLEKLKPMILKMAPESCVRVAVRLDSVTYQITSTSDILLTLGKLLEEENNAQMIARNLRRRKEAKRRKVNLNRVHPDLSPDSRRPTVSFII